MGGAVQQRQRPAVQFNRQGVLAQFCAVFGVGAGAVRGQGVGLLAAHTLALPSAWSVTACASTSSSALCRRAVGTSIRSLAQSCVLTCAMACGQSGSVVVVGVASRSPYRSATLRRNCSEDWGCGSLPLKCLPLWRVSRGLAALLFEGARCKPLLFQVPIIIMNVITYYKEKVHISSCFINTL